MAAGTARAPAADKRYQPLRLPLRVPIPLLCFQWGSSCAPGHEGLGFIDCAAAAGGVLLPLRPRRRGRPPLGFWDRPRNPATCQPEGGNFFPVLNDHPLQMPFLVDVLLVLAE